MLQKNSSAPLYTSLTLALLTFGTALQAQNGYPGYGQRPNFQPGQQQQFQQFQQMRQMMATYQSARAVSDPTQSATATLLKRDDVRDALLIDGRQREQLDGAAVKVQQDLQAQRQQMMQQFWQQRRGNAGQGNFRNMTPEERNARMATMQTQRQEIQQKLDQAQAAREKDVESVLRPAQVKRLHELDLQWRGALAVADTEVGDKLALTAEQKSGVNALLQEFRTTQQQQRQGMFQNQFRQRRQRFPQGNPAQGGNASGTDTPAPGDTPAGGPPTPDANGPIMPPQPPTLDQMQRMMDDQLAATTKARKAAETKVLALLTPAQKQKWLTLQGKPFRFRDYL